MQDGRERDERDGDRQDRQPAEVKVVPLRPKPVRRPLPQEDDGDDDGPGPGRAA